MDTGNSCGFQISSREIDLLATTEEEFSSRNSISSLLNSAPVTTAPDPGAASLQQSFFDSIASYLENIPASRSGSALNSILNGNDSLSKTLISTTKSNSSSAMDPIQTMEMSTTSNTKGFNAQTSINMNAEAVSVATTGGPGPKGIQDYNGAAEHFDGQWPQTLNAATGAGAAGSAAGVGLGVAGTRGNSSAHINNTCNTNNNNGNPSSSSTTVTNGRLSLDSASAKVGKKRSRASRRAPTTVLTTDTSNFRAMVQEFTGIPAAPFASSTFPRHRLDFLGPRSALSPPFNLLRPFAHRSMLGNHALSSPVPPINSSSPMNFLPLQQQQQQPTSNFLFQSLLQHPPKDSNSLPNFLKPPNSNNNNNISMSEAQLLNELGLNQTVHAHAQTSAYSHVLPDLVSSDRRPCTAPPPSTTQWPPSNEALRDPCDDACAGPGPGLGPGSGAGAGAGPGVAACKMSYKGDVGRNRTPFNLDEGADHHHPHPHHHHPSDRSNNTHGRAERMVDSWISSSDQTLDKLVQ